MERRVPCPLPREYTIPLPKVIFRRYLFSKKYCSAQTNCILFRLWGTNSLDYLKRGGALPSSKPCINFNCSKQYVYSLCQKYILKYSKYSVTLKRPQSYLKVLFLATVERRQTSHHSFRWIAESLKCVHFEFHRKPESHQSKFINVTYFEAN